MKGWVFISLGLAAPLLAQTVTGTLVNGVTGEPLPGVAVALDKPHPVTVSTPHITKTDSAGVFRFEGIDPGDYMVLASHPGFEGPPFSNTTVHVESGNDPDALRLTLMPWPNLNGRVFDRQHRPVAKVSITASPTHGSTPWPVTTDSEGRFTFKSLQPARYTLLATPPESAKDDLAQSYYPDASDRSNGQPITVIAGPDLNGYDITLRGGPFFKISGRVVDEHGDPAPGASVRVRNADTLFAKVTADADGRFEIEGIPEMNGRLSAQWKRGAADVQGYIALRVSGHDLEQVELRVAPPVPLAGTVELDGKEVPPGTGYGALEAIDGMGHIESTTNESGFRFDDAYAGRYRLIFYPGMAGGRRAFLDSVLMGGRDMALQEFDLTPGMQPVRVILKRAGGRVQGTVEGDRGEFMTVLIPREERLRYVPFIVQTLAQGGRFEFPNVRPGDYYALTLKGLIWLVDLQDPVFLEAQLPRAAEVRVERGGTATVKLSAP